MDNKEKVGGQDRARINVNEEYEVEYWKLRFGVSSEELKRAVEEAGTTQAEEIELYLKKSRENSK
jgi:hypothetical protein